MGCLSRIGVDDKPLFGFSTHIASQSIVGASTYYNPYSEWYRLLGSLSRECHSDPSEGLFDHLKRCAL